MLRDRFDVPEWVANGILDGSVEHIRYPNGLKVHDATVVMADGEEVPITLTWWSEVEDKYWGMTRMTR